MGTIFKIKVMKKFEIGDNLSDILSLLIIALVVILVMIFA